jgi:hypothetical protein
MNYVERQEIIAKSPISFLYLKKINIAAGILHLANGIAMLALTFLLTCLKAHQYSLSISFLPM